MTAAISVVIPTYNRAKLVQEAIESVLGQNGDFQFEIIVIDDGSTPETEQALRPYQKRIRYVWQENAGLNASRNRALKLATGDYVALLDDDDLWLPFKTQLQMAALRRFPAAAFVHSDFHIWKPENDVRRADGIRTWFPRRYEWSEMYPETREILRQAEEHIGGERETWEIFFGDTCYWALFAPMVLPSAAIIRRETLDEELSFPEFDSTCGDWDFFARLSHRYGGVFVAGETTLNRSHEDLWRLTRTEGAIQMRRRIAMIRRLWRQDQDFLSQHRVEVDATEAECLRKLARRSLVNGDSAGARAALNELRILGKGVEEKGDTVLWALTLLPFSRQMAGFARSLKGRAGNRPHG